MTWLAFRVTNRKLFSPKLYENSKLCFIGEVCFQDIEGKIPQRISMLSTRSGPFQQLPALCGAWVSELLGCYLLVYAWLSPCVSARVLAGWVRIQGQTMAGNLWDKWGNHLKSAESSVPQELVYRVQCVWRRGSYGLRLPPTQMFPNEKQMWAKQK